MGGGIVPFAKAGDDRSLSIGQQLHDTPRHDRGSIIAMQRLCRNQRLRHWYHNSITPIWVGKRDRTCVS
jgi:hypothetical protein